MDGLGHLISLDLAILLCTGQTFPDLNLCLSWLLKQPRMADVTERPVQTKIWLF